jgi:hypothetical protein
MFAYREVPKVLGSARSTSSDTGTRLDVRGELDGRPRFGVPMPVVAKSRPVRQVSAAGGPQ